MISVSRLMKRLLLEIIAFAAATLYSLYFVLPAFAKTIKNKLKSMELINLTIKKC